MGRQSGEIHLTNMIQLVALCLISAVSGSLVTYPNGAVVPYHHANQAATASHLATRGFFTAGVYSHLWKREAEADADADAGLVGYSNGAVVPYNPYLHGFGAYHVGYSHLYKREAEADAGLVGYANGAVVPYNSYLHGLTGFGAYHTSYSHLYKREAEADPALLYTTFPHVYAAHHVVGTPLVAHSNGAVVPLEPASVVKARADHLALKYGA